MKYVAKKRKDACGIISKVDIVSKHEEDFILPKIDGSHRGTIREKWIS